MRLSTKMRQYFRTMAHAARAAPHAFGLQHGCVKDPLARRSEVQHGEETKVILVFPRGKRPESFRRCETYDRTAALSHRNSGRLPVRCDAITRLPDRLQWLKRSNSNSMLVVHPSGPPCGTTCSSAPFSAQPRHSVLRTTAVVEVRQQSGHRQQ
jgi:hypothetical protein